ncbi:aldo/keto reductase, partial [bacterium]|nr:aldo/keto reductase [bacterium]
HIQAGRVRAIGASNWTVQRIEKANSWAKGRNLSGFCASQIGWNLAVRNAGIDAGMGTLYMDEETFAWHRASGLAVTAFNAQANGFFSGQYGPNVTDESNGKVKAMMRRSYNPESFARLERAEAVAKRRGCTANQVAVAWLTSQPFLVVAIGAPKTTDQMEDTCGAGAIELTAEEVGFLERG